MLRSLVAFAVLAFAAAAPASAYTPNPDDPYVFKKPRPCLKCGIYVNPGARFINPARRFDSVLLNPQPLPPKSLNRFGR